MNIDQLYPRKWLAADDLAGRAVTVTIDAVTLEQVRNPRTNRGEPKLAVAFVGKKKRLLANKTQAYALAAIAGKETEDWSGRQVTLAAAVAPNGAQTIAVTPAVAAAEMHRSPENDAGGRRAEPSHDEPGERPAAEGESGE